LATFAERAKKRKKRRVKYIALPASLPSGLKKSVNLTNFYVVTGCFFLFDPGQIVVDFEIGMT